VTAEPTVTTDVVGRTLVVTLNRPGVRNAIDTDASRAIASAMDVLDGTSTLSCAVITGSGGCFCSGMDLGAFARDGVPTGGDRGFAGLTDRPPDKPLIAAVEGFALAGGFEIALAADLIVAAEDAQFGLPEVTRGLIAASGGLVRLARALPHQAAAQLALTGDRYTADELRRLGLVNIVTQPGKALSRAIELAEHIAENAPLALIASKTVIRMSGESGATDPFAEQSALARAILESRDAAEGVQAFREKRQPSWTGT
jgi:enoyl-CoA hydratase